MNSNFLNRLLCVLIWIPESYWMYKLLKLMLPLNPNTAVHRRWVCFWFAVCAILAFIHYFAILPSVTIAQNVLTCCIFALFALRGFSGRIFTRLFATVLLMITPLIADVLTSTVYFLITERTLNMDLYGSMSFDFVKISGATAIIGLAMQGLTCMIWCRTVKKRKIARDSGYLLIFLLLGLSILASGILASNTDVTSQNRAYPYVYISTLLAVCGGMFVFLNQLEKKMLAKELAEIRRLSSLEQMHYTAIEARQEEIAKIRHDYTNVLTSVNYLLQKGSTQEAVRVLSELSARISQTQEQTFCRIPVVNAVLTEKQQQCAKRSLSLEANLDLPEELPIQGLDLCSAFTNLMDLAMESCPGGIISLSCQTNQSYLVIKCVCPTDQQAAAQTRSRQILQSLADRYHGNFFCECQFKTQTAQLSLLVV